MPPPYGWEEWVIDVSLAKSWESGVPESFEKQNCATDE